FVRVFPPLRPLPGCTPFPYTTLFRSLAEEDRQVRADADAQRQKATNPQAARALEEIKSGIATIQAQIKAKDQDIEQRLKQQAELDRKSTRLNSSHVKSSYAVFCLKKK